MKRNKNTFQHSGLKYTPYTQVYIFMCMIYTQWVMEGCTNCFTGQSVLRPSETRARCPVANACLL